MQENQERISREKYHGTQITRFTASQKTFFFNHAETRGGGDLLRINAIYGKGGFEKLTLLPSQLIEFYTHLGRAIEKITGFQLSGETTPAQPTEERCPNCHWHLLDPEMNQ